MNTITRTLVGVCATFAVLAPTAGIATAAPAPDASSTVAAAKKAKAKKFKVIATFQKAKFGACKVSVNKGTAWRVFGRLDTKKVKSGKYAGTLLVIKAGQDEAVAMWRTPLIGKGKYSKVGSVLLPKKPGYSLVRGIGSENMGDGGPIKISRIGNC